MVVIGHQDSVHDVASESDRVGPANQPEWTTRRVFAETDIYVIPTGEIEFNQFYINSHPRHGTPDNMFESEFEAGLPWRTQFDVELNYSLKDGGGHYDSTLVEVPHALADWGKLPLNPAVDAGWRFNVGKPDAFFGRLLLAEEFGKRIHLGATLSFEHQIGGERENTCELDTAVSYVLVDRKLAAGIELLAEHDTAYDTAFGNEGANGTTFTRATTVMLGPALLFNPSRKTHVGLVPLFGVTRDAPAAEAYFVFGLDLEPFHGREASNHGSDFGPVNPRL